VTKKVHVRFCLPFWFVLFTFHSFVCLLRLAA
jgi:hypothetical protein